MLNRMKPEKAIGMLIHHEKTWKGKFPSPHFEACEVAIEALEKQIPKKVIGYECPNCGECTDFNGVNKFDYCAECGQRLDWN